MPGARRKRRAPSTSEEYSDESPRRASNDLEDSTSFPQVGSLERAPNGRSSHESTSDSSTPNHVTATSSASSEIQEAKQPKQKASSRNGKHKKPAAHQEPSAHPSSTPSSGFSSAMSDASAHSTTSGTSSPYASGSVFHRLNPGDIKYRDEKAKVLRTYIVGKMLGEGSYAKVKEGIDSKTKKMVAIKILSKKTLRRVPGGEASVSREIGIIESLSHKNVISIHTHFPVESKQKYYIVFEYMGGGTLTSLLEGAPNKRLPLYQVRKLFQGLISALEHLREHRILHRDIKPDNLLLDANGDMKLADFGVAEIIGHGSAAKLKENAGIGSPAFQAPELIASPNSTPKKSKKTSMDNVFKSDVWSAGIVLFIMVVGEYPFSITGNIMLLFEDIAAGKFEVPDWVHPDCADLISQMLQTNPTERIDLAEIRNHPFFKATFPKTGIVPVHTIHSMWPHQDKSSLATVIKKMKSQLEREEEQERASRFSFDAGRSSIDEEISADGPDRLRSSASSSATNSQSSSSKCAIM